MGGQSCVAQLFLSRANFARFRRFLGRGQTWVLAKECFVFYLVCMKKIASFTVNHLTLLTGIYVSRKDYLESGEVLTTFDLRFTRPNVEPVMDTAAIHAFEHLGATFLRNHATWADKTIYFGPMGCRTGFYVIFKGDLSSEDIVPVIKELCSFVIQFDDTIPGASARDCGNYLDLNLSMAQFYAKKFTSEVIDNLSKERLVYPE